MVNIKNLYWMAGILEGEGSFVIDNRYLSPRITVAMTDRDIIEKFAFFIGTNVNSKKTLNAQFLNSKKVYIANINGKKAAAWMMTFYTLMGERRRERIKNILSTWKSKRCPKVSEAKRQYNKTYWQINKEKYII